MGLILFEKSKYKINRTYKRTPYFSIYASSQAGFNKGCEIKYGLKEGIYILLYYDSHEKVIGVQIINKVFDSAENAYVLLKDRKFSIASFSKYFGLDIKHLAGRYPVIQEQAEDCILRIPLNKKL